MEPEILRDLLNSFSRTEQINSAIILFWSAHNTVMGLICGGIVNYKSHIREESERKRNLAIGAGAGLLVTALVYTARYLATK